MTQTSITAADPRITAADVRTAVFTIEHLGDTEQPLPLEQQYLELIRLSRQELTALEAGMHNQGSEDRARQNRAWSIQNAAQLEIVKAALAAGVPSDAITDITHAEQW